MIDATAIALTRRQFSGLYESFYFRGTQLQGPYAFWLKHNFLRLTSMPGVVIESTLVLFSRNESQVWIVKKSQTISQSEYLDLLRLSQGHWDHFHFRFSDGSHLRIHPNQLEGEMASESGQAAWKLSLKSQGEVYRHFSKTWFYTLGFPRKKILTVDTHLIFEGSLRLNQQEISGTFVGMNGHNWGKEHAPVYAYANCNRWSKDVEAYFDGFCAKIYLWPTRILSPYLSCASLKLDQKWFHFNRVEASYLHTVRELSSRQWQMVYCNRDWILRVQIQGHHAPWVSLVYEHPSGEISTVKNTKFATGHWTLKKKRSRRIFCSLRSEDVEFETSGPSRGAFLGSSAEG